MNEANETKFDAVRRLRADGLPLTEISERTGLCRGKVRLALNTEILQRTAERLLSRRLPTWWRLDADSYRRCVLANFCDVLEAA